MSETPHTLSRRERQIMDVIYARGQASAAEVLAALDDPPSYSAVRALLRILEEKGHAKHKETGGKYVYRPTRSRGDAGRGAMRRVLKTFFDSSLSKAVAVLLDTADTDLSDEELADLKSLIDKAGKRGGRP